MKICFIAPKAYPLFNPEIKSVYGGAEVQLFQLGKALSYAEGCQVSYIVADYGQDKLEQYDGIYLHKSFIFKDNLLKRAYKFYIAFKKAKADLYIQRTLTVQSALIAFYCQLIGKKFVYMIAHDGEADRTHKLYSSMFKALFADHLFRFASAVVVQNDYQRQYLRDKVNPKRLFVLKKGIDFSFLPEAGEKHFAAVWIGRSIKSKRPELFLKLAKMNPQAAFLLICPQATGEETYFREIKEKAERIENLTFIEYAANKDIYRLLAKSAIFLLTSDKEGDWPQVVLEAAAMKLPILSYTLNYADLIEKYGGGIHCKGNFQVLNEEFRRLINDRVALEAMGSKAYQYVKENHDIRKCADQFLRIVEQVAEH